VILLNLKQEYLQLSVFFALSFTLSVLLLLLSYSFSKTRGLVEITADRQSLKVQTVGASRKRKSFRSDAVLIATFVFLSVYFNDKGLLLVFLFPAAIFAGLDVISEKKGPLSSRVHMIGFLALMIHSSDGGILLDTFLIVLLIAGALDSIQSLLLDAVLSTAFVFLSVHFNGQGFLIGFLFLLVIAVILNVIA
jgi:hypothetical protein